MKKKLSEVEPVRCSVPSAILRVQWPGWGAGAFANDLENRKVLGAPSFITQ
jgi:hypothetical protein